MIQPVPPYKEFCPERGILDEGEFCNEHKLAHLDLLEWKTKDSPKSIIVCIHAMFLCAKAYSHLGRVYASYGFDVYSLDLRGFGQKRNQSGFNIVNFSACVKDIEKFLVYIKSKTPELPIILLGESMGGALSLKVASELPHLVNGVICSAPAWKLFKVPKITYYGLIDKIVGEPGRAANLVISKATSCPELQDYWKNEGSTRLKLSILEAYAYLKLMQKTPVHAKRIDSIPTLVIQGLNDRLSKPRASALLYKHLATPNKQFLIAAHKEHVVLQENQLTEEVLEFICYWLQYHFENPNNESISKPFSVLGSSKLSIDSQNEIDYLLEIAGLL